MEIKSADELKTFLEQPGKIAIKFGAPWCAPCKILNPILQEVSKEYPVAHIDIDELPELSVQYSVKGVPTTIVFEKGEPIQRISGVLSKDKLIALLK